MCWALEHTAQERCQQRGKEVPSPEQGKLKIHRSRKVSSMLFALIWEERKDAHPNQESTLDVLSSLGMREGACLVDLRQY